MIRAHGLAAAELINVWERGAAQHPVDRALTVLCACTQAPWEELASASIGERDAALFAVYEQIAGPQIEAYAECPECRERLEYSLDVRDLSSAATASQQNLRLTLGESSVLLRLPDSRDLAAIACCADIAGAAQTLANRCVVDQAPVLSESMFEQIGETLAAADPLAETLIDLACEGCGHAWQVVLDIEIFLWTKISATAKRLLREVHVLALAYGWSEADILKMGAARRDFYLEMVS